MTAIEVDAVISGRDGAPVVVLANSLGTTRAMWDPQLAALEERFRVVRYDSRGHGASPVPAGPYSIEDLTDDVVALLDRLGVARAHFVGLSLGGMTGMSLAARHPERVGRLALLCTAAYLDFRQVYADRAGVVRQEGTAAVADVAVGRWFTPAWAVANPDAIAGFRAMIAATPAEGYASACQAIAAMDLRPLLPTITAPTLVVAGADDQAIPPAYLETIADSTVGIPGARYLAVPQAAHLANVEQAAVITPALIAHLSEDS